MRGIVCLKVSIRSAISVAVIAIGAAGLSHIAIAQTEIDSTSASVIARGGGTTIIQGGTGKSGGFTPVLTTLGFHAEKKAGTVTGDFECLARAPENTTGAGSAQFTKNVMYVTGQITGVSATRDTATLTGTAEITGLGAGSSVPFTFVVHKGGSGSAAVLTTGGSPSLVFNEILLDGSFDIFPGHRHDE
jgi:hypothetical protein